MGHKVWDQGVAGSNPAAPTIFLWGLFGGQVLKCEF